MKTYLPLVGYFALVMSFLPTALAGKPKEPITFDYPDQSTLGSAKATVKGKTRTLQNDLVSFKIDIIEDRVADVRFDIFGEVGAIIVVDELFEAGEQGKLATFERMETDGDELLSEAAFVEFSMRLFIALGENGDATCAPHWQEAGLTPC
jgi:hypothetical protein